MEISRLATEVIPANPGLQRYKKKLKLCTKIVKLSMWYSNTLLLQP